MPTGIPAKYIYCRKCTAKFKTLSDMRKHQWAAHRESYVNLSSKTPATVTAEISVRDFIDIPPVNGAREMTVSQLLAELTSRHKFMGDMISAINGVAAQFREVHHE